MDYERKIYESCCALFTDKKHFVGFLEAHCILQKEKNCPECGESMDFTDDKLSFSCGRSRNAVDADGNPVVRKCNTRLQRVTGTFLDDPRIELRQICNIINIFLHTFPPYSALRDVLIWTKIPVLQSWVLYTREICYRWALSSSEKIGGRGVVVEIDEMMVCERIGRAEGAESMTWAVGGFERGSNKVFMVPVPRRGRDEFFGAINEWVLPETIVVADCWSANFRSDEQAPICVELKDSVEMVNKGSVLYKSLTAGLDRGWRREDSSEDSKEPVTVAQNSDLSLYLFKRGVYCEDRADTFFRSMRRLLV